MADKGKYAVIRYALYPTFQGPVITSSGCDTTRRCSLNFWEDTLFMKGGKDLIAVLVQDGPNEPCRRSRSRLLEDNGRTLGTVTERRIE